MPARMLGATLHGRRTRYCPWRANDGRPGSWPRAVHTAFKRQARRREHRDALTDQDIDG